MQYGACTHAVRSVYTKQHVIIAGVLPRLAALCGTRNDNLRAHLMRAVVRCCRHPDNRAVFSSLGAGPCSPSPALRSALLF
jgi:hypothetical protein